MNHFVVTRYFSKELTKVLEDKILKLRVLRGENYLLLIAALPRWILCG